MENKFAVRWKGAITLARIPKMTIQAVPYEKERIEHLVDQLIKLQRSYDLSNGNNTSARVEILDAMKAINKAIEMTVLPKSIVSVD